MSRRISLYMLIGTVAVIGVLFYQVIQPFIFSLLFAMVLAVLFRPFYVWVTRRLGGRRRLAAAVTTTGILLLILLPLGGALVIAGYQLLEVTKSVAEFLHDQRANPVAEAPAAAGDVPAAEDSSASDNLTARITQLEESRFVKTISRTYQNLPVHERKRLQTLSSRAADGFVKSVYERTVGLVGDAVKLVIGLVVTALTLYYLFADGEDILRQGKELFPLGEVEEDALIDQFGLVCRGVIVGTVVAALAQSVAAGIGYLLVGAPNVLLLVTITMFFAFVPFIGAGTVVTLVSLWLAIDGRYVAAICLFLFGAAIVSTMDNVIRSAVIGSQAKMNPLVAFITVVGALQLIGLWGIIVGPLIAAFFYTLLKLLRERIVHDDPMLAAAGAPSPDPGSRQG